MTAFPAHRDNRRHFRSIVTGEHNQCIIGHTKSFECFQQLADDVVHLKNKITVRTGIGFTFEPIGRERRQMNRLHRMKQKKRLIGTGPDVLFEEFLTLFQKYKINLFEVEVRRDHAGTIIP